MAAVGELREEHGEIEFTIVPADETARRRDEIERYHMASRGHGLVAFTRSGDPVVILAGHAYGRAEIEMAIAQVAD